MSNDEQAVIPESEPVNPVPVASSTPIWFKRAVMVSGLLLLIVGAPAAINLVCIVPLVLLVGDGLDSMIYGVISLTVALLTVGAGGVAYLHANRSLQDKPSKPMRLPAYPVLLIGLFLLLIAMALAIGGRRVSVNPFIPLILLACAILPPLWAVAWMIPRSSDAASPMKEEPATQTPRPFLSWRRGLLGFVGGATVSVFIAILLEILLPVIVLSLVFNLADTVAGSFGALVQALSSAEIAEALTNPGFVFLFVQIAIIAPLAEEIAKPLVTLPLLRQLTRREAFWIGAMAGAGFAALENVIYATSSFTLWAGILIVRALGSALHPLGSGLMAQGWRDVLNREKDSGKNWLRRFGVAVTVHAVWNGGSLLVITLGGARFFGELPPDVDVLGLSAAGTTLAFLIILGLSALWIGRAYGYEKQIISMDDATSRDPLVPSDRAMAIWALACLAAIVPAGIAGLKIWLR